MSDDILDHAARLLEREPAHCLPARTLHGRTARDTGSLLPLDRFLATLAGRPDRFTVIAPGSAFAGTGWERDDLRYYDHALAQAGTAEPLVTLAEPDVDTPASLRAPAPRAPADALLAVVHDSLARVLRYTRDTGLQGAAGAGIHELYAMRQELRCVAERSTHDATGPGLSEPAAPALVEGASDAVGIDHVDRGSQVRRTLRSPAVERAGARSTTAPPRPRRRS